VDPQRRFPDHDRVLRAWLAAREWPVTDAFSLPYAGLFAWRHECAQGHFTLYVSAHLLTRHTPSVLGELLDTTNAEAALREVLPLGSAVLLDEAGALRLTDFGRFDP
jgi:hypothetical protein